MRVTTSLNLRRQPAKGRQRPMASSTTSARRGIKGIWMRHADEEERRKQRKGRKKIFSSYSFLFLLFFPFLFEIGGIPCAKPKTSLNCLRYAPRKAHCLRPVLQGSRVSAPGQPPWYDPPAQAGQEGRGLERAHCRHEKVLSGGASSCSGFCEGGETF